MKSKTFIWIMILFAALASPVRLSAQKQIRYIVIDVGTLGGSFGFAYGINNKGSIVGFAFVTGDSAAHAFLWRRGVMTDLGTLAGADPLPFSAAFSINDHDEAVGLSETSTPDPLNTCGDSLVCLPVLWRDGAITALPTLGGLDGQASAINNRGQAVGVAQTDEIDPACSVPVQKPTVWEKGEVRALPTTPFLDGIVGGGPGPAGNNAEGQVVGVIIACDFSSVRAVIWEKQKVIDMGTIEGLPAQNSPAPIAINNKRQAVGTYTTNAGINRAFIWQDGVFTDLGTLPGDNFAEGGAINDRGQVVGQSCSPAGICTVFLWQDGVMMDLNAMVPANSSLFPVEAKGINSAGEIVGRAADRTTGACCHAFIAIPDNSAAAETASATAQGEAPQRPQIIIPDHTRKMLEKQLGHRHSIPVF